MPAPQIIETTIYSPLNMGGSNDDFEALCVQVIKEEFGRRVFIQQGAQRILRKTSLQLSAEAGPTQFVRHIARCFKHQNK